MAPSTKATLSNKSSSVSPAAGRCAEGKCFGLAAIYALDDRGVWVRFPVTSRNFSIHQFFPTASGAHSAPYRMGTGGSFPGVNRPENESDRSLPYSAKGNNGGAVPPLPPYMFMAWCLINSGKAQFYMFPYWESNSRSSNS
jgi:hypothetical protein